MPDPTQDLQSQVNDNAAAIDAVKQLTNSFAPELTALGQDVASTKARLDVIEKYLGIKPQVDEVPDPIGGE